MMTCLQIFVFILTVGAIIRTWRRDTTSSNKVIITIALTFNMLIIFQVLKGGLMLIALGFLVGIVFMGWLTGTLNR